MLLCCLTSRAAGFSSRQGACPGYRLHPALAAATEPVQLPRAACRLPRTCRRRPTANPKRQPNISLPRRRPNRYTAVMSGRVRIWHSADSHIGADLPVRPRCGRPRRGDDLVASFRRVMRRAIEQGCDLVIHAGDVFDCPRPSGRALAAAARRVLLRHATLTRSTGNRGSAYVPKTVVDALCVAVRQLRGHPDVYRFLSREEVAKLDTRGLLAAVFGLDAGTWSNNEKNWTGFSARS